MNLMMNWGIEAGIFLQIIWILYECGWDLWGGGRVAQKGVELIKVEFFNPVSGDD